MDDPEKYNKIFTKLGFTYVDDGCEGNCEACERQADCTVYPEVLKFEKEAKREKFCKVVPFRKK